jgi:hypothetical protein
VSAHAITLITLVITIVILILLASITINLALKDNGLFNKTKDAKIENAKAKLKEQIESAILTAQISLEYDGSVDTSILETELINTYGIAETDIIKNGDDGNLPWKIEKDGCEYTITKEGEVKTTRIVTVEEIIEHPEIYYGKEVANYNAGGYTYRIFYVDAGTYQDIETGEEDDTKGYFGDNLNTVYLKADYVSTTTPLTRSYDTTNTKVVAMNPLWAIGTTSSSTTKRGDDKENWNVNEYTAAYLCSPVDENTNLETTTLPWASYYDSSKASYVIGGASVEMFMKSYNQTHDKNADGDEALSCVYQSTNVPGYVYKVYGTTQHSGFWTNNNTVDYTDYNSMYCGRNGNKEMYGSSYGYWLASPSAYYSRNVCYVDCYFAKTFSSDGWTDFDPGRSLAPLVSLKSDVEIEIYE